MTTQLNAFNIKHKNETTLTNSNLSDCKSYDFGKCDATGHCLSICQQMGKSYMPCLCTKKEEKCRICCRHSSGNVTSDCLPFRPTVQNKFGPYYLSKGRPCFDGICNGEAICEQKTKDYVSRFWKVIQTVTVSGFGKLFLFWAKLS